MTTLPRQVRVALQGALVAGLDGAEARPHLLGDHVRDPARRRRPGASVLIAAFTVRSPAPCAGAAAGDARAAAQAAHVGHAPGARAARLDAAQRVVAAGDADAADALERLLLIAVDVALAEHVRDRAAAVGLGAQQLEETGRLHLLGEARAALGVGLGLLLGQLRLLLVGELASSAFFSSSSPFFFSGFFSSSSVFATSSTFFASGFFSSFFTTICTKRSGTASMSGLRGQSTLRR